MTLPTPSSDLPTLVSWIQDFLDQKKAEDIKCLQAPAERMVEYMIIASGQSQRHVGALAHGLYEELKHQGFKPLSLEGLPHCDWVILDLGAVMVHLFRHQVRLFYHLEDLWDKTLQPSHPPIPSDDSTDKADE